jgi:hypothetical protein
MWDPRQGLCNESGWGVQVSAFECLDRERLFGSDLGRVLQFNSSWLLALSYQPECRLVHA